MSEMIDTRRRHLVLAGTALAAMGAPLVARAADALKVGLIVPMSGPFASTGRQIEAAVKLYQQKFGDSVAGRKVEILLKDDGGVSPDVTKRLAQELVARDKAQVLMGFGLTPLALAAAPIATQAKVPMIVTAAATSIIPQRSPYIVRTGFTLAQVTSPLASWAAKNGIKSVVTFVSDYGPGLDAEKVFVKTFSEAGGKVMESVRVPLRNPGLRTLPAAGERRQAAGFVRFCTFRGRRCRVEAVHRAGIGGGRDSSHLHRRCAR